MAQRRGKSTNSECASSVESNYMKVAKPGVALPKHTMHRTNSCISNRSVNSLKQNKLLLKRASTKNVCPEDEEDMRLFLETEREVQEAYLDEPVRIEDLRGGDVIERTNLINVLNNQLINKKSQSEKKPNGKPSMSLYYSLFVVLSLSTNRVFRRPERRQRRVQQQLHH